MRDVVICEPVRTAVGRDGGMFKSVSAAQLAATVISAVLERTGLDPDRVDDVILGQCYPNGEAPAIGRVALLDAGLPVTVPGLQIDRRCGSGLQAVLDAAMRVQTGVADIVLAGGTESMSQAEHYVLGAARGLRGGATFHHRIERGRVTSGGARYPVAGGMLETAENLRREFSISRERQDEFAVRSHQNAISAIDDGRMAEEIVPVVVQSKTGQSSITVDEHPRRDTTVEGLARLRAIRSSEDPDSTVTAGNASGQNDAAAVCVVTTAEHAEELGLVPLVRLISWAVAGVAPERMGIGPVPATEKVLARAGLQLTDMDLIELNEAFAAQVLAVLDSWKIADADERLNVNGSGISLGHAVGSTGARILATGARELRRREGRYMLETMCIGGGQGMAAIFERVA